MKIGDVLSGILLLIASGLLFADAQTFPVIPGQAIGPRAFPELLCILLALASLGLILRGVKTSGTFSISLDKWVQSPPHLMRFAAILAALVFYITLSGTLGFLISATVILLFLFIALGTSVKTSVPMAVLSSIVVHLVFYKGLHIPLPWGPLPVLW